MEKVKAKRHFATVEEKLAQLDSDIAKKEEELKTLKEKRKELLDKKKQKDLNDIYKLVSQSGKSLEEIKELLSK